MPPRYQLNSRFFESIDDERKSYWLGFMVADGCVRRDNRVEVCLSTKDTQHLELLKEHIESSAPLYFHPNQDTVKLGFGTKEMAMDLKEFGVVPNKSTNLTLDIEDIDAALLPHFWRGVVDGDGSLCITGQGYPRVSLCGAEDVVGKFDEFCRQYVSYKARPRPCPRGQNLWYFDVGGRSTAYQVTELLYKGADVYLQRKKERSDQILKSSANIYVGHWASKNKR